MLVSREGAALNFAYNKLRVKPLRRYALGCRLYMSRLHYGASAEGQSDNQKAR